MTGDRSSILLLTVVELDFAIHLIIQFQCLKIFRY